jgi:hypothetical protein
MIAFNSLPNLPPFHRESLAFGAGYSDGGFFHFQRSFGELENQKQQN